MPDGPRIVPALRPAVKVSCLPIDTEHGHSPAAGASPAEVFPMFRLPALTCLALMFATPVFAQSVSSYDDSWYRGEFWAGEYPNGFTVLEDTTLKLRPALSSTDKTIDCPLPAKATIHPWNTARVQEYGLTFVTFSEIQDWEVTEAYEAPFYSELDAAETTLSFKPGDHFRFLIYYAEGTFLMDYNGVQYTGDQGLLEHAKQVNTADRDDEWLRIDCPNNMWGWLYFPDLVIDDKTIAGPNIVEYGRAADLE
jgi:hypothetical protein